jgi:predicted DNA binding protein
MRRLVVEFPLEELAKSEEGSSSRLTKVKSFVMLQILKMLPGELAAIVRVEMKDQSGKIEDLFPVRPDSKIETELLQQENDRTSVYFIRFKANVPPKASELDPFGSMPYFSTPFEFRNGRAKLAFLGNAKQIKKHLEYLERHARGRYKVVSLTDARFSPNSPIARLTEKQRRVLITAYKLGYYDLPRRIGSEELARKLNLVKSTFVAHRRKAERRLLTEMLSEL